MAKFIIEEQVPALVTYRYEVEAENEDDAMELVMNGMVDSVNEETETIYSDEVVLEFTRQVVEE
jgi:hypothetical protein